LRSFDLDFFIPSGKVAGRSLLGLFFISLEFLVSFEWSNSFDSFASFASFNSFNSFESF